MERPKLYTWEANSMRYLTLVALALTCLSGQACHRSVPAAVPAPEGAHMPSIPASSNRGGNAADDLYQFKCGENTCDARTSYCEMIKTDVASIPSTYSCKALPDSCRPDRQNELPACGCFPRGTRCIFCSKLESDGIYHFQRTCIGGGAGNQHRRILP